MITRITSHRDCWSFILHEISMEWISSLLLTYYINNVTFLITFSKKSLLHFAYFCSRIKATNGKPMEMIERFMNNHKCETSNVKYLIIIHIYVGPRIFHAQSVSMIRAFPWFSIPQLSSTFYLLVDGFFIGTNRRGGGVDVNNASMEPRFRSEHRFPIIRSILWWSGCKYVVVIKALAVRNAWYERSITGI